MAQTRYAFKIVLSKPAGKRPLRTPWRRCEHDIKLDLEEIGSDDAD
jgi:hypothetical protein